MKKTLGKIDQMSNSRAIVTAVLLALSTASTSALSAAQNEVAVASADGDVQNQRSVEDLVAIAKAGESNEAINDAVPTPPSSSASRRLPPASYRLM